MEWNVKRCPGWQHNIIERKNWKIEFTLIVISSLFSLDFPFVPFSHFPIERWSVENFFLRLTFLLIPTYLLTYLTLPTLPMLCTYKRIHRKLNQIIIFLFSVFLIVLIITQGMNFYPYYMYEPTFTYNSFHVRCWILFSFLLLPMCLLLVYLAYALYPCNASQPVILIILFIPFLVFYLVPKSMVMRYS